MKDLEILRFPRQRSKNCITPYLYSMEDDFEIFNGKKFSDLCREIHSNSQTTRNQIDVLVSELRNLIKGTNDALMIVPLIKDYLSVGVNNDDQLLKLLNIVSRVAKKQLAANESGSGFELTKEDRDNLQVEIDRITSNNSNSDDIDVDEIVSNAKSKLKR